MRFIHTADWHLGNRMHNVDRKQEFGSFLSWLKTEIEKQKAETLVIAGDIFDTANPPTEARTQYNHFLASLLRTCCRNVIIVGGNHDSGVLLDSEKAILNALNIHVVGTVANITPKDMVFELINEKEEVIGIGAAVPYAHENELRNYYDSEAQNGTLGDHAYGELYKQVYAEADKLRNGRKIPVIATGHLYAANLEGRFAELEQEDKSDDGKRQLDVIGTLGSIHVGTFPEEFDYVALGHIHYPTTVAKNPKIRYSGSPFILGFDEHNIKHCVLAVETEMGAAEPKVQKIPVPETVIFRRVTGNSEQIKEQIEEIVKAEKEKEVNIEVNYDWEEGIDINEVIEDINASLPENVAIVHRKHNENQNIAGETFNVQEDIDVEDLTYEDIFRGLILQKGLIDKTNLSDDEIQAKQDQMVEKYMSLLIECVNDYEKGIRYED